MKLTYVNRMLRIVLEKWIHIAETAGEQGHIKEYVMVNKDNFF